MTDFTVETVMAPVVNDDWDELRNMTDVMPGTLLLEDPEQPMLIFQVEADTLSKATALVQGVTSVAKLEIVWGRAYLTEFDEIDTAPPAASEDHVPTVVPDFLPTWLENPTETQNRRQAVSV